MKSPQNLFSLKFDSPIPLGGSPMNNASTTAPGAVATTSPANPKQVEAVENIIKRPSHYVGKGGLTVIDVLRAFGLDKSFELGSAVKYILRSDSKGSKVENIRKAREIIDMWLSNPDNTKE